LKWRERAAREGFRGEYRSLDIGHEQHYDYAHIDEVNRSFEAILCMDVIEHLELREGLGLVIAMVQRLEPGGLLVLQTPNARCIVQPLSWDMTHVHCYNATDLWAYLTCLGLEARGYRVAFAGARRLGERIRTFFKRAVVSRLLGC